MRRTGDWKAWRTAQRERGIQVRTLIPPLDCLRVAKKWDDVLPFEAFANQLLFALQGAVRKGVKKYQNKKGKGKSQYQELDEDMEPSEMRHVRTESTESYQDPGYYPMSGGISGSKMYQPPAGSPDEAETHLMAEMEESGRPRSPSQAHLMANTSPISRPRASSQSSPMVESQQYGRPRALSAEQMDNGREGRPRSLSPGGKFVEAQTEGREMV